MEKFLPSLSDPTGENMHIYEFMLQAWTLLSCCTELRQKKYRAEYGNLRDLADSLSEYIESAHNEPMQ